MYFYFIFSPAVPNRDVKPEVRLEPCRVGVPLSVKLTVLSLRLSCPISRRSSAGSTVSPPINSSTLVCVLLALMRARMQRRTEPMVSLVWDQMSKSSTWRPWLGNLTTRVMCLPRNALNALKTLKGQFTKTILSLFTHPRVAPNLYECVCSEHKDVLKKVCNRAVLGNRWLP